MPKDRTMVVASAELKCSAGGVMVKIQETGG